MDTSEQQTIEPQPATIESAPATTEQTPSSGEGTPAPAPIETSPEEKAIQEAAALGTQEKEQQEIEESDEETEEEGFKPNIKFKAGIFNKESKQLEQKEYDIDPKFHAIMKDPESEKLVRELHEKAFGIQSVKDRLDITRHENTEITQENKDIRTQIGQLSKTYQSAVKTGNWHKMDDFFAAMSIPQEHILKYALAKAELSEMAPEQQRAVLGQLEAERRAELLSKEKEGYESQTIQQQQRLRTLELESTLARDEVSPLAQAWDERTGNSGAFKELVRREGEIAWLREGVDITPEQAVQRVIKNYGLADGTHGLPMAPAKQVPSIVPAQKTAISPGAGAPKATVAPKVPTIPNIAGRTASPMPTKVKSMDELMKYRKEQHGL